MTAAVNGTHATHALAAGYRDRGLALCRPDAGTKSPTYTAWPTRLPPRPARGGRLMRDRQGAHDPLSAALEKAARQEDDPRSRQLLVRLLDGDGASARDQVSQAEWRPDCDRQRAVAR